ncbi:MAG: hypothetical protein KIS96_11555 [Bauldia sp.]|nr:hypothetical protein [Bauldia sp.]
MRGILTLYIDQYGAPIWAWTVSELRQKSGGGRVARMYVDKVSGPNAGRAVHCGYVIGSRWFSAFRPIEVPA